MDNGTGPNCQSAYHYWQWLIVCWVGRRKPHFHHHRVTAIKIFYKHMKSIFVCSFRLSVCQKEHGATQIHYSYMHNNLHFTDVIISKGPSTKHQNSMHGRLTICTEPNIPLTKPRFQSISQQFTFESSPCDVRNMNLLPVDVASLTADTLEGASAVYQPGLTSEPYTRNPKFMAK